LVEMKQNFFNFIFLNDFKILLFFLLKRSFGCILYEMIVLKALIVIGEPFRVCLPDNLDEYLVYALQNSLEREKEKRANAKTLLRRIRDYETSVVSDVAQDLAELSNAEKETNTYARILMNLSQNCLRLGDYRNYLKYSVEALHIRRNLISEDHEDLERTLNEVGLAYSQLCLDEQALKFKQESLDMCKRIYMDKDHESTAASLNNLAIAYCKLGDFDNAIAFNRQALEMFRRLYAQTNEHVNIGITLNNAGTIYFNKAEFEKALEAYQISLEIREKLFSNAHSSIASSKSSLGLTYGKLGDYENEMKFGLEALNMYERLFSNDHPDLAESLWHVAMAYEHLGDRLNAEKLKTESREMRARLKN
jgi:tetratricopeptide (TPR) repeat protein